MYLTQGIHRATQINGDGIATSFNGRQRTWRDFADRVARLAGALRSLGVSPGDRVSMLALNSDRFVEHYYALFWIGAVAVPVNIRWSLTEILYSLDDAEPSVLIFDDQFAGQAGELRARAVSLRHCIYAGDSERPDWAYDYEQLIADHDPVDDLRHGGDALAAIMYTGGTTGFPKGVMLSHTGLAVNVLSVGSVGDYDDNGVFLHAAPLFHMAAAMMMFLTTMFGGRHTIVPSFAPAAVSGVIAEERVTNALLVPTMIKMLLDHYDAHGGDLSSLRSLLYGASPMPEVVVRRVIAALPDMKLYQAYGQTELSPVATILGPEHHCIEGEANRLRSAGRALPDVEIRIAADDGHELPRGEVGEVWVRGPNTMLGYWNKPDVTAATLVDGWVRTGDAARMDTQGFLFIVDRVKDMVISGGENVYSAEVENAILKHPAVADCAVIGVPDERWGERVHAIVVLRSGETSFTLDILAEHCRTLIATYKCPRSLELRDRPLPLSAAGKVLKTELRAPYWSEVARNVG